MADLFSDLDNQNAGADHHKPFFAINYNDEQTLLDWLKAQITHLKQENQDRFTNIKNNYKRYKGMQYLEQKSQVRTQPDVQVRYKPQMVIPMISDVVDEKVARLLEYKPSFQIIPQSDETADKIDTKIAKKFLKHIDQVEKLDEKFRRAVKSAKIGGESFVFVLWSKDKGRTILKAGQTVSLPDGNTIKGPVKEGDIEIFNATALDVLYEQAKSWDKVEYLFFFDYDYTEKLKREYPEKKDQIHDTMVSTIWDYETMSEKSLIGKASKIYFWHKKTKFLDEGFEAIFTMDTILKKGALPYDDEDNNDGDIPVIRFIDGENEDEVSGESFINKVKGMASQVNNLNNTAIKQIMLAGHPKWFVDGSSVDAQLLGNDTTVVKVTNGAKAPVLAQSNPVSPQTFEFMDRLEEKFYTHSKSNSVVRGEPPPGVTAFVALQYVSESENRRISTDVASTNESIRRVYDKALKRAGQFYKKTDKRTMLILGKDNRWVQESYDPETLCGNYSIILQNSTALPDSKSLRTQFIMDMGKTFPEQFPQSQVAEMLDLGQNEKLLDLAGLASRAAEDENELILDGKAIPDPERYEDLITHWRVHVSAIQDIGFKMKSSDQVQENMIDHILATEMLMMDMAQRSTAFAQLVNMQCPQFPMLMEAPAPVMPMQAPQIQQPELGDIPKVKPLPGDPAFGTPRPEETGVAPGPEQQMPS